MNLCQSVWNRATKACPGKTVNLSKLCNELGVRIATIWTYHHRKARWTAEHWLQSCLAVGAAHVEDGRIVIDLTPDELELLKPKNPPSFYFRNSTKE